MKLRKRITLAKTIAWQIKAESHLFPAFMSALYGRRLTRLELECDVFLHDAAALREFLEKNRSANQKVVGDEDLQKSVRDSGLALWRILQEVIFNRQADKLRALAHFIEEWNPMKPAADKRLTAIIWLKSSCDREGRKMTVKAVADFLHREIGTEYPTQTEDGLAVLRRLLKRLKFPIASDAKGRPKKQTRKA